MSCAVAPLTISGWQVVVVAVLIVVITMCYAELRVRQGRRRSTARRQGSHRSRVVVIQAVERGSRADTTPERQRP